MCPRIHARGRRAAVAAAAWLLVACASNDKPAPVHKAHHAGEAAAPAKAPIVQAVATPAPPPAPEPAPSPADEPEAASVLYFDSDVYQLKEEYKPVLQAHARRLQHEPALVLRIDAYTDNQGPPDYNLELARMRAQSVMKQLVSLGVPASRLQVVSHGEARPGGRGAAALASSRRVELSYR